MREIKFKARHRESGKWRTFTLDELCNGHMTERYMWDDWREYASYNDKNGDEVCEDDTLLVQVGTKPAPSFKRYQVVYEDSCFMAYDPDNLSAVRLSELDPMNVEVNR